MVLKKERKESYLVPTQLFYLQLAQLYMLLHLSLSGAIIGSVVQICEWKNHASLGCIQSHHTYLHTYAHPLSSPIDTNLIS